MEEENNTVGSAKRRCGTIGSGMLLIVDYGNARIFLPIIVEGISYVHLIV